MNNKFNLTEKVVIITGGAGMLGRMHTEVITELGGIPILLDTSKNNIDSVINSFSKSGIEVHGFECDITNSNNISDVCQNIIKIFGGVDVLINNAALTAKGMSDQAKNYFLPVESYPLNIWKELINVNLVGHFICTKIFGSEMKKKHSGSIINISSEIGLISPDKRIYIGVKNPYLESEPLNNPPGYSVTKAGLIAMGKCFAEKWVDYNIRVNTLCPAGVYDGHDKVFLKNYSRLVPMNRMAEKDEYKGSIAFLSSEASSPLTGATIVVDGGKTCW